MISWIHSIYAMSPGFLYGSILFTYEIQDFYINPWYYDEIQNIYVSKSRTFFKKKTSTEFDGWIDIIHDCIHDSTIQMDTDMDTDGYRYNMDGYRWIYCLISFGTPDLMDG